MGSLHELLNTCRQSAQSEREKGRYFEELTKAYFTHEASYRNLYSGVWFYGDWARKHGRDARDTGIDLLAEVKGTNEHHAIQCKFYDEKRTVRKEDIDSFLAASGKKPFAHRFIVSTTNSWSDNAEWMLEDQQPPVSKIDLYDLENSQIDWAAYTPSAPPRLKPKFSPRPHQIRAVSDVLDGLRDAERGKLIMACGTGKTFTALKIAEKMAGAEGCVLFLVPTLALLSQILTEWTQQSTIPLHSYAVCSDAEVGKKRRRFGGDAVGILAHELRYPAATKSEPLARAFINRRDAHHMSVVFSTYHSIDVVSQAQKQFDLPYFDLIICDEAHRSTGVIFDDKRESRFVRVHNDDFIGARRRLYMTATPRIYGDSAKATAEKESITLCSMDDEKLYGKLLHLINFSKAVEKRLLTDYKVLVLAVEEKHISLRLQNLLKDENNQLKVDDAARIVGCWKALSREGVKEGLDGRPMRRAVAFAQVIDPRPGRRVHKVSSRQIAEMFQKVVETYLENENLPNALPCEARHVDGAMSASEKEEKLQWLRDGSDSDGCRILTNVRCLSEGVDVPSLDAVLFLTSRNSQVDVVQSVGRVMRRAEGKTRGYVILPVVIPAGVEPHDALNDNRAYKVVWDVLQALRSHDDGFDDMINKIELGGPVLQKIEIIAVSDTIPERPREGDSKKLQYGLRTSNLGSDAHESAGPKQTEFHFEIGELERAIYAKVVKRCGNRYYWDEWASDIAKIAQTHITRIQTIVNDPGNVREAEEFGKFASALRDDLNDSISDDEIIEMLAQHLITRPVFEALFSQYSFAARNPISLTMQKMLKLLYEHHLEKETDTLDAFYESVRRRASGIEDASGKQRIVKDLYDKFFRSAFPRMTERLGIVYTPVEVVDFIVHSVNYILQSEFNQSLGSDGVHIIDPFVGTGTFITRLLQSGLIPPERLPYKFQKEIHANEIVLLAYYVAAVNIESAYHSLAGGDYKPFGGICLTDTFQMYERGDLISGLFRDNSDRRSRQKELDIQVIIANPPYSVGQRNANDNNQNVSYPSLDAQIQDSYVQFSKATYKGALYDSYIRAIRYATDRIKEKGIVGLVTNAGFLEANTADGLRKCLAEDFSSIYVFHLRGNARTSGEQRRREKDNVFGQGTRTPIAISILVKNPDAKNRGQIYWHDIGDYLSREEKLSIIGEHGSVEGITRAGGWTRIVPDKHFDWVNQRDASFDRFVRIGDKKDRAAKALFENFSNGLKTNRDAWCYNASRRALRANMERMIGFYHSEMDRLQAGRAADIDNSISSDKTKISWSWGLRNNLRKRRRMPFRADRIYKSIYRPYSRQWAYFDRNYNDRVFQLPQIFPLPDSENLVISTTGKDSTREFSALASNCLLDQHLISSGWCFPLYLYEKAPEQPAGGLFELGREPKSGAGYRRRDGISDAGFRDFQTAYPKNPIDKKDLFYYIYGIFHSPEYRSRYANNLSKELPRIPVLRSFEGFRSLSRAGRKLADLHANYEEVKPHGVTLDTGSRRLDRLTEKELRVVKMKFARVKNAKGKLAPDKSAVVYNEYITIRDIPLEAYDYAVNGKPALEWVMERQAAATDRASGIVNDANLWASETMNNPGYPLELFRRVITVSLETMKIIKRLPALDIGPE